MTKRIALALAAVALSAVALAPSASAGQTLISVFPDPNRPGEWCAVYQNSNTGVFHTKCSGIKVVG